MCGRFPQSHQYASFRHSVAPQLPNRRRPRGTRDADNYRASYNVAPNSNVAVVRRAIKEEKLEGFLALKDEEDDEDEREEGDGEEATPLILIQSMRWGLLPPYTKSPPQYKDTMNTINARADVLLSGSPLWSRPFNKGQRCVVFTQGFYEWQKTTGGGKLPHFVGIKAEGEGRRDKDGKEHAMMPLAGLWERCVIEGEEEPRYTFTIITTDVCPSLSFLHDRQPLILPSPSAIATWLDPDAPLEEVRSLVRTFDAVGGDGDGDGDAKLEWFKVPKEVGKVGNDDEGFILPVETRRDGLMAAFGRQKGKEDKEGGGEGAAEGNEGKVAGSSSSVAKSDGGDVSGDKGDKAAAATKSSPSSSSSSSRLPGKEADQHDVGDSNAPPPPSSALKAEPSSSPTTTLPAPSSRFSPDPFNPPLSPPRPNGGYSTTTNPTSGLTKYGKVSGNGPTVKKRGQSPPGGEGARLEGAFQRQRVKQEVEEACRVAEREMMREGEEEAEDEEESEGEKAKTTAVKSPPQPAAADVGATNKSPPPPQAAAAAKGQQATPNKKGGGGSPSSRSAASPTRSSAAGSPGKKKGSGSGGGSGSPQQQGSRDIRAFFQKE